MGRIYLSLTRLTPQANCKPYRSFLYSTFMRALSCYWFHCLVLFVYTCNLAWKSVEGATGFPCFNCFCITWWSISRIWRLTFSSYKRCIKKQMMSTIPEPNECSTMCYRYWTAWKSEGTHQRHWSGAKTDWKYSTDLFNLIKTLLFQENDLAENNCK